ncbi:hypothetical protein [Nostoc sp. CHAB 5715]|uniref:hypothetical protein n=1 Tax=Nostoc sp. CHAB 5715 TaxID=2780400 RepID=UPI001E4872EC|nr:hypothetical protein [Nostoc sp. CHAB 5715]MCC5626033.1 hypothetical protein [Nostoc sp. CHAB 5715]
MPSSRRLADVERTLELWYENLGSMEQVLARTYDARARIAINQQIRDDILPQIRRYEVEYWQLLAQDAPSCAIEEFDARNAIVHVVQEVKRIENKSSVHYPDDFMQKLLEIRDKLNEPETPATAKAKLALPLLPGILSYEVELDTENALRWAFLPLKGLFKKALEKN